MSNTTKSNTIKKKLIKELEASLGIVTKACEKVDIARSTFYEWYKDDQEFATQVDNIGDIALDMAESELHKQIKAGIPVSTIFFLKTKGRKRGYIEKKEHEIKGEILIGKLTKAERDQRIAELKGKI